MENGVKHQSVKAPPLLAARAGDTLEAILLAECAMVQRIDVADLITVPQGVDNAFGQPVAVSKAAGLDEAMAWALLHASGGERVALLATAEGLARARDVMVSIADKRLSVVIHVVDVGAAEAVLSLADLGWGILFASDVGESFDLSLAARRAAEDSGTPFIIVHPLHHGAARHIEPLTPPTAAFIEAFIGPPEARLRRVTDPGHPAHAQVGARAFAERVPFALASALRELETLTGRRRDLVTQGPSVDAALMLVGLGALGDVLIGEVPRLRAAGHDVGAIKLTAFRPFPGPRLVRLLARALSVSVLESKDEPLAQSNPLTRELKAAFADALTWAPDYPGIGKVPRIHSGVTRASVSEFEAHELDAVVLNMLAGEHGKRFFALGAGDDRSVSLERQPAAVSSNPGFAMRGVFGDAAVAKVAAEVVASAISSILSLKVRAVTRGAIFELEASPLRPQGVHAPQAYSLIAIDDLSLLVQGNPLARLGHGGMLGVPSSRPTPEALWADLPPYVKAIAFDRHAEVVGWAAVAADATSPWLTAATFAGIALASLARGESGAAVDGSLVERGVAESVRSLADDPKDKDLAGKAGQRARQVFDAQFSVSRAVVEGDEAAVRLGRRDARAQDVA